ncbi:hypothetical protein EJ06DRAFT_542310 [Trichodelitschia bisporula]|uniref:RRM domain-containing protein n=1 Tax=Trichodelitschia bisporula TaxID=703511 RepID=A0A6G1I0D6_9PEZI|nr:hypothetical protein EJ06DRAFT_542310 [Trichodelitschia bisporula]
MPSHIPAKIQNLHILPLSLPTVPSCPYAATHYLYLRPDAPPPDAEPTPDTARSLFLANLPIDADESTLRRLFKSLAAVTIERVEFPLAEGEVEEEDTGVVVVQGTEVPLSGRGRKRKRGQSGQVKGDGASLPRLWEGEQIRGSGGQAVVVCVDRDSADAVIKAVKRLIKQGGKAEWKGRDDLGETRYRSHHRLTYPPRALLQSRVNNYLAHFATLEAARAKMLAKQRQVPDEDGFITVTRGGRSGPARLEEAQAAQERLKEREKKRAGGDFYRFQTREGRKRKEMELKENFERDAKRVREMREKRGKLRPE